jgi:predicted nucleic-acid-binding protein
MVALDTNVIVRWMIRDEADQTTRARAIIDHQTIFATQTVVLEVEWVLRDAFKLDTQTVNKLLHAFCNLSNLTLESEEAVLDALEWHPSGLDFADALHLASSRAADQFATFDSRLRKRAAKLEGAIKVIEP